MIHDLVVVGAGFAGLACARQAALAGLKVVLLEKKHAAGARLHTTGVIVKDAVDTIPWLRDVPPELGIARAIHLPHPARPERTDNLERTELRTGGKTHVATCGF